MKKVLKTAAIVVGCLVVGGFIGWAFDRAGISTPIAVAVSVAAMSGFFVKAKA